MKMKRTSILAILCTVLFCAGAYAADGDPIKLPPTAKSGGITLIDALSDRQSSRDFGDADLTPQQLSDLLWATAGVNRANGGRTYPVAMNRQDMSVYVFSRAGIYRYLPESHELKLVAAGDHRAQSGQQGFVAKAAVNLAYVQDTSLWKEGAERASDWGFAHAGAMMQNAYLFSAGQGWSAVVRGSFDAAALTKLLKLSDTQSIKLIQSIGPK